MKNPYREILRKKVPIPLLVLLSSILTLWLWDNYFGENLGYAPGTEAAALLKIDRDLKLAEAMRSDPPLLRWLAHGKPLELAVSEGIKSLEMLSQSEDLSPEAQSAYLALRATREGVPVDSYLLQGKLPREKLNPSRWWNAKIASETFTYESNPTILSLRTRAVGIGTLIWILGIIGFMFIPRAVRCLRQSLLPEKRSYVTGWPSSLGVTVFLLATLSWIGLVTFLNVSLASHSGIHPVIVIALDSAARFLPTIIALSMLFRKYAHASRALGVGGHFDPPVILGLYSILVLLDQPLRWWLTKLGNHDPTGGISFADSGLFGLVFLIISASLIAPVAEEILYRGVLFRSLANRTGVIAGALISAIIFSLLHFYDWYGLTSVAIFGFVCALFYQSTRSLANVIILHMFYNTTINLPEWVIYHAPL